jgi:putative ABC transport system substrate-binding protein
MHRILRREFLIASGLAIVAPFVRAQQAKGHRIAWLSISSEKGVAQFTDSFLQGMRTHGYVVGSNLVVDARYGNDSRETLERLALEAAALKPAVFVTQGPAIHVARKVHGDVPVVFGFSGDPLELGVIQSLARPGGRFTGVTFLAYELSAKRVELIREILPGAKRIAVVSNPSHVGDQKEIEATQAAATKLVLEVTHHPATDPAGLERALAAAAAAGAEAIVIHPDGLMVQQREAIGRFSMKSRIPAISGWASIADGGALVTYGPVQQEAYRRLAYYVDRILRGAQPGDLPVELPAKLEMVVNLKTAKALNLAVPQSVLVRADRVIQ